MAANPENASSAATSDLTLGAKPALENPEVSGPELSSQNAIDEEKGTGPRNSVPEPTVDQPTTITGMRWVLVCIGFYFSCFLYGLDNTIAADIQAAVISTYGDISKLSWIGTGFPLGSIAVIQTLGKGYGIFNVKYIYGINVTVFSIGSAICGAAPNMNALIIGRVIAGVGGAGMYLGTLNLITILTPFERRPIYIGGVGIVWGVGTILGPIIGGSFADSSATWRWAFYINLLFFAAMLPALAFIPSIDPQPTLSFVVKVKKLDWVGVILNAGLYTSFVLALTFGGASWAWGDGRTIATFVVCAVVLIVFAIQQTFSILTTPESRLFPVEFVMSRSMVLLFIATSCAATCLFVPIFYVPLFFQFTQGDSGLDSAVRLLPFIIIFITLCMAQGIAMPKVGYYYPFYIAAGLFTVTGGALMYTVKPSTSASAIYGYTVLIAIGASLTNQASYSVAPGKVQPHQISDAIGWINVAQIGSIVIGLTVSGTIFQNIAFRDLNKVLQPLGLTPEEVRSAIAGAHSAVFENLDGTLREQAVAAIVHAINQTYALVIAAGAFALVTSVFLRREKLGMKMAVGG